MARIFLIGYMGSGKTTLGKALARRMGLSFIDTDLFIENRYHKKLCGIFASEGEGRFREIESRIIREVAEFEDIVVSTGGGTPCFGGNMSVMNNAGTTVFLNVSVKELAARLQASKTIRPVLQGRKGDDLADFISESLEKRKPSYEQAKIVFDAESMDTEQDVDALARKLEEIISAT